MSERSDIIIVGGGLNGGAMALAAANAGFRVTLIDALATATLASDNFDGRAYALALTSVRMLTALGLWQVLEPNAQPMKDIKVTDGRAGEGASPWMMHFDHNEIEEGPMGWMVEDRVLRRALLTALDGEPAITHLSERKVVSQSSDASGVTVTTDDGATHQGRLLIGSDGRQSGTAERAGITRNTWDYGQTAVVCAVAHEASHDSTAHQFFMPGGPLAILPLVGNQSAIVWSEERSRAEAMMAMDDDAFLDALRPAFGSHLGNISLVGQRFAYPLGLSVTNRLIAPRVALVGDAAHGIHPIAGQGLNAGLRDVAALADVLTSARQRGEDIGSTVVLDRYQRWRGFEVTKLALATDGFNRLFSNDNPLLRAARDLGMGAVNAIPGLRRGFIREAAGLNGQVPRLMQG